MTADVPAAEAHAQNWMLIGTIAGAVGIKGEVKVDLQTDFPERFKRLKLIYVGDQFRPTGVLAARQHAGRIALLLDGVADRDAAAEMRGQGLYIPDSEATTLPEGRYYHHQIVGLAVETTSGEALGTIEEILSTGSNDVYVTRGDGREVLIPAIRDVVVQIDLPYGKMIIEPIEGLLP